LRVALPLTLSLASLVATLVVPQQASARPLSLIPDDRPWSRGTLMPSFGLGGGKAEAVRIQRTCGDTAELDQVLWGDAEDDTPPVQLKNRTVRQWIEEVRGVRQAGEHAGVRQRFVHS